MVMEGCELDETKIPGHIAFIMDGNRRWALQKTFAVTKGHHQGIMKAMGVIETCGELGVKVVSLFSFSKENWNRPSAEIRKLFHLFHSFYERQFRKLKDKNIKVVYSGDLAAFPEPTQKIIKNMIQETQGNTGMIVNLALNYSGQMEIIRAVQSFIEESKQTPSKTLTEESFRQYLFHPELPFPDFLIRTSGEIRLSNFFLWQIAYTELYFTDVLWPDFERYDLVQAIMNYQQRTRRFGGNNE